MGIHEHEIELHRADAGYLVAVCSCGQWQSEPGHKGQVEEEWRTHKKEWIGWP